MAKDDEAASNARVRALLQAFMGAALRENVPFEDALRAATSLLITIARSGGMSVPHLVRLVEAQAKRYLAASEEELARKGVERVHAPKPPKRSKRTKN